MSQKVCTSRKQILWWCMLNWFLLFGRLFSILCTDPRLLSLGLLLHLLNPVCHFATELMVLNLLQTTVSPSSNQNSPFSPAGNKAGYPLSENLVRARRLWSPPAHPTSTGSNSEDEELWSEFWPTWGPCLSPTHHTVCIERTATLEGDDWYSVSHTYM